MSVMANAFITFVGFLVVTGGIISISIHKIEEGMIVRTYITWHSCKARGCTSPP